MADEIREVDYVICRNCSTPCYIFEMNGDNIVEALCTVCGNDATEEFSPGDIEDEDDA